MIPLAYVCSILALALFLLFVFFHLLKTNNGLPRNYPLLGMTPMLLLNFNRLNDTFYDILSQAKGTFLLKGLWFTNTDMLVTSDPKNIYHITAKNFYNYPKGTESKEIFDFIENSLFNFDFEEWNHYRKFLHDYLKQPQLHTFMNRLVEKVNESLLPVLQHVARQEMVVDISDVFIRHLLDSAWLFSTGYELNTLSVDFPENPFVDAIEDACQAMFYRHLCPSKVWKLQRWLRLGSEKKLHEANRTLREIVQKCVLMRKEELITKKLDRKDCYNLLNYMLLNPLETGEDSYHESLVRDGILALVFATYETTSTALTWLFWLLSENPEVEAKIRQEIIDTSFQVSNKDELSKLVYLHAVICETLRLYPPAPSAHRHSVESDVLPSGHRVSPNTRVILSAYSVGRMKSIWGDDCLEFRPERWIDQNGKFKYESSTKFYVFNAGPRICPGKDIGFMLLKAITATVVYNFHMELVETVPPTPKASIVLQMKHGMKVKVKMLT